MKTYFLPALKITALTLVLFGVVYPLLIVGVAKIVAPDSGKGELVVVDGKTVGFKLIGQKFTSDKYFTGRPSAVGYNAAATGGSNKGPSNPDYLAQVDQRIQEFLAKNPSAKKEDVPIDLVTASGGGLDPHISVKAARVQAARIAKTRNIAEEKVTQLIDEQIERPLLGVFGTSRINVLNLNIALDKLN
jgi:potassium-transporting ATPase KdpC subunit